MEHTKKMVLVHETTYSGLLSQQNIQNEQTDPLIFQLMRLNEQLQSILNDRTIPADFKYQKYMSTLNRYLQLKDLQKQSAQQRYIGTQRMNTSESISSTTSPFSTSEPADSIVTSNEISTTPAPGINTSFNNISNTGFNTPEEFLNSNPRQLQQRVINQTGFNSPTDVLNSNSRRSQQRVINQTPTSVSQLNRTPEVFVADQIAAESEEELNTSQPGTSKQQIGLPEYSSFILPNRPILFREKGNSLASFIDANPNIFKFDDKHQLIHNGEVIENSDIKQLIKDFSHDRITV